MNGALRSGSLPLLVVGLTAWSSASVSAQESAPSAPSSEPASTVVVESASEPEPWVTAAVESEPEGDEDPEGTLEIIPTPPRPMTAEEAEAAEERALDEDVPLPPPPDPEWRLHAGAGIGVPTNGYSDVFVRFHQDIEFQPNDAAPFLFGIGGAEYIGPSTLGSIHGRFGAHAWFCEDAVVRCQGTVALTAGAFFAGASSTAFEVAGDADARFLFGSFELSVRVGFGGGAGINLMNAGAALGAAF